MNRLVQTTLRSPALRSTALRSQVLRSASTLPTTTQHINSNSKNGNNFFTKAAVFATASALTGAGVYASCDAAKERKESATGIVFPEMLDGLQYCGSGVRVKYGFVKVYAVGAYAEPLSLSGCKSGDEVTEKVLLNPKAEKTIRIVMNRGLSVEKYMAAINEALLPRMNGVDLNKLDDFKAMNPPGDLKQGSEMVMSIRGNVMLYRSDVGGFGRIESDTFCRALEDVYFGKDPVSPALVTSLDAVCKGTD